jgi:hypothetical protein
MPTFEPEIPGMNTAKLWIGLIITAALYSGCSKSGVSGTPQISLKSVNSSVIPYNTSGSLLTFTFSMTESSYNPNDTLYVTIKHFTNISLPPCDTLVSNLAFNMVSLAQGVPSTTSGSSFKADLDVSFSNGQEYEVGGGYPDIESNYTCTVAGQSVNDTTYFSFVLGHVGHYSDTAKSGPIVIIPAQ